MTKLEQKLIELGYEVDDWLSWSFTNVAYSKNYRMHNIVIYVDKDTQTYKWQRVLPLICYNNKQDIDNLQKAFNQLQKDLEVLKNDEKN